MEKHTTLTFEVIKQHSIVYIVWPWPRLTQFLLDAAKLDVRYEVQRPLKRGGWIELQPMQDCNLHGEYRRGLYYGLTPLGLAIHRCEKYWGTHYLTQHGLDGLPKAIWTAAYEYAPGEPSGSTRFVFKIHSECGLFQLSFHEWQHYFVSGRNSPRLDDLGIQIIRR